jgi:DNA-nicking Smr family endonuclease
MSDRKKSEKPFHNPFKQLKGLSVSSGAKGKPQHRQAKLPEEPAPTGGDENELFAREMARLGVEGPEREFARDEVAEVPPQEETPAAPASEEELFLASLGEMEVTFSDQWPQEEASSAVPRRMKRLRQGKLVPQAQLDLHGLTRAEAREKVRYFLEDSVYQGRKTVLIVTGRGKGSEGEPVLRGEIERFLSRSAGTWVSEWGRAPRRFGGEGALVVFLKEGGQKG